MSVQEECQYWAFTALASLRRLGLSTVVYVGDLRLNALAMQWESTGSGRVGTLDENKYLEGITCWMASALLGWARFPFENMLQCVRRNIYVIYFDSISPQVAERLNYDLEGLPYYLGAVEVNERLREHRVLYAGSLLPLCRVIGPAVSIFREGFDGEDLDRALFERCERAGFTDVRYEVFSEIVLTD